MDPSRAIRVAALVCVVATLGAGCLGAPGLSLNSPPVASFSLSDDHVEIGEPVSFDASLSSDPDGPIALYKWNFGDGSAATGVDASHAYGSAGVYMVSLTVLDPEGLQNAHVHNISVNAPPTAAFTMSEGPYFAKDPISFDAGDSHDPDGRIQSYAWTFGDGDTSSQARVSHLYLDTGTYTVGLRVVDDSGASDDKNLTFFVDLHTYEISFDQQQAQLSQIRNFTLANQTKTSTVEVFRNNLTRVNFTLEWTDRMPLGGTPNDVLELRVTSPEGSVLTARGDFNNISLGFNLNPVPAGLQTRSASGPDAIAELGDAYLGLKGTGVWVVEIEAVELGGGFVDGGFVPQPIEFWTLTVDTTFYVAQATEIG